MRESGIDLDKKELARQMKKINKAWLKDGITQSFYVMQFQCGMCMLDPDALPAYRHAFFYNGLLDKKSLLYRIGTSPPYYEVRRSTEKSKTKKKIIKMNKKSKVSAYQTLISSTISIPMNPKTASPPPSTEPEGVAFIATPPPPKV